MKKYLLPLLLLISFDAISDDFRGSNWGDSVKSVKENEKAVLIEEDADSLAYITTISGIDMAAVYTFENDKLVSATYLNQQEYTNKNRYISDYKTIKELLIAKYGEPVSDDVKWFNDSFKNDTQEYGNAISIGHLAYLSKWVADGTEIVHVLSGNNYSLRMMVLYNDLSAKEIMDGQQKQKDIDQL